MADIEELDDTAQRLRVMWRKTNNFYASFASILFDTKKQFSAGNYPGWDFESWLYKKAGLSESYVMQQLKVFNRVIAAEARDQVEQENIKIAAEKRAAAKAREAEKRAEMAEKRAAAAHKKREQERIRQEQAAARAADKAERERQKLFEKQAEAAHQQSIRRQLDAIKAEDERRKKADEALEQQRARQRREAERKKVKKQQLEQEGPENPELRQLLADCVAIEATSRVEYGRKYTAMKRIIDAHQAGRNAQGQWWTWGGWCASYIKRSRKDIWRCIDEYVASCHNSQDENVVSFPKAAGSNT